MAAQLRYRSALLRIAGVNLVLISLELETYSWSRLKPLASCYQTSTRASGIIALSLAQLALGLFRRNGLAEHRKAEPDYQTDNDTGR